MAARHKRPARSREKRVVIVVGGGPAPGINAVISAVIVQALSHNLKTIGVYDGFKWLIKEGSKLSSQHYTFLTASDADQIHLQGGSILRLDRADPTSSESTLSKTINALKTLRTSILVAIGGDDTLHTAIKIAQRTVGWLTVIHVPKTIDNDLPLPKNQPTFGFETGRHRGVAIVKALVADAATTNRHCHVVISMGREAGHLALGIGKGAGAHLTLIPEEFGSRIIYLNEICDIVEGTIIKRLAAGHNNSVIVLAEGLLIQMGLCRLQEEFGQDCAKLDEHGNIKLGDIDFGYRLRQRLKKRCAHYCHQSVTCRDVGYELRSGNPIVFDNDLCRDLGYEAIEQASNSHPGGMVIRGGIIPFAKIPTLPSGRVRTRRVDIKSSAYQLALKHMVRLTPADQPKTSQLAQVASLNRSEFSYKFGWLMKQ